MSEESNDWFSNVLLNGVDVMLPTPKPITEKPLTEGDKIIKKIWDRREQLNPDERIQGE